LLFYSSWRDPYCCNAKHIPHRDSCSSSYQEYPKKDHNGACHARIVERARFSRLLRILAALGPELIAVIDGQVRCLQGHAFIVANIYGVRSYVPQDPRRHAHVFLTCLGHQNADLVQILREQAITRVAIASSEAMAFIYPINAKTAVIIGAVGKNVCSACDLEAIRNERLANICGVFDIALESWAVCRASQLLGDVYIAEGVYGCHLVR